MPQKNPSKASSKAKNEPIVLSGSVFLDGILAEDHPRARMPAQLRVGDIRLHNVNKPGERSRFETKVSFSGFMRASVWDGKRFRSLLLRKLAACESTYVGPVARRERSVAVLRFLSTLVRRQAVWSVEGKGYVVTSAATVAVAPAPAPAATTAPAPEPQAPAAAVSATSGTEATVTVTVTVTTSLSTTAHPARPHQAVRRRKRTKAVDANQLPLFDNLK